MWECARRVYVELKQYGRLLYKSRGHAVYTIESSIALVPLLGDKWHTIDLNESLNFCYFNQKTSVSPAQEPENWTLGSSTNKCIVDSPAFLRLLSSLDTWYIPASYSIFSRVIIPAKYISVNKIVLASLSTASHCSLTTDLWTGCHKGAYIQWLHITWHQSGKWSTTVFRHARWMRDSQLRKSEVFNVRPMVVQLTMLLI